MKAIAALDLTALRRLLRKREISPIEIVQELAALIRSRDRQVRAWVGFDPAPALAQARDLMRGQPRGLLWGIPIGVKDVIDTEDFPTAYGSPIYLGHRPVADAAVVAQARHQGAIILGKTQTNEFAGVQPAPTTNPLRRTHSPGGSSSGSAAAVADGMVPAALGTQTGGSIIRPASYCGVVGFKPTYGLISRAGVKPLAESLDTVGTFARRVRDAGLLAEVGAGRRLAGMGAAPTLPPRFGLWQGPGWSDLDHTMCEALEGLAQRLHQWNAQCIRLSLPDAFALLPEAHLVVLRFETQAAMAHERRRHNERLSEPLRSLLAAGARIPWLLYREAQTLIAMCRSEFSIALGTADVLIVPAAAGEAPQRNRPSVDRTLYGLWTALGAPSLALPFAQGSTGLPLGVQLVGRPFADRTVLHAAAWLEKQIRH